MSHHVIELPDTDHRSLAATLAPVLVEACDNRLEDLVWFKADWQAGGAATGTAVHRRVDDKRVAAVVKLPVVQRELVWTRRLQDDEAEDLVVPRLYASGETLGGYDLAWVVIERFEHGPLGLHWHDEHIPRIAEAAARFHAATSAFPIDQAPAPEPWDSLLREAPLFLWESARHALLSALLYKNKSGREDHGRPEEHEPVVQEGRRGSDASGSFSPRH